MPNMVDILGVHFRSLRHFWLNGLFWYYIDVCEGFGTYWENYRNYFEFETDKTVANGRAWT